MPHLQTANPTLGRPVWTLPTCLARQYRLAIALPPPCWLSLLGEVFFCCDGFSVLQMRQNLRNPLLQIRDFLGIESPEPALACQGLRQDVLGASKASSLI